MPRLHPSSESMPGIGSPAGSYLDPITSVVGRRSMPLTCLRFPLVQKFQEGLRRHRARIFKLTVLLTDYELARTFQYRQRRDAFFHRYLIVLHQILILVYFADVHVHHFVTRCQNRSQIRPLERHIKHVTVVTPVRTKDDQQALVRVSSFFLSLLNL